MRIAIIYPSLRAVGGAENVVVWLADSLVQKGHTVVIFTREFAEAVWGKLTSQLYRVHLLEFKKYRSTLKTNREAGNVLTKALAVNRFDVINPHNYPANLWVDYARKNMRGIPKTLLYLEEPPRNFYEKITDSHYRQLPGLRSFWNTYRPGKILRRLRQSLYGYRRLDRNAVHACDRVLANSHYTAELARMIYNRDVIPCPLGIPVERFGKSKETCRKTNNNGASMSFVLTVARIELSKNFDTILNAARMLKSTGSWPRELRYKIAGKGPYLEYYRKKCHRYGLNDIVEFLGFVTSEELQRLYSEALFIVHIPLDEPFGLVPLEAALFKKPSIVSDHGGPSENVIDGITGLHADALVPGDVAYKLKYLWEKPDLIKRMGEAAYAYVLKNATWDIFIHKFESHLMETIVSDQN